jgi:5-hydroxyisourate hydrolase
MSISTHVLDTARGCPAAGVDVHLERRTDDGWSTLSRATTDDDGRVSDLLGGGTAEAGVHRLTFATGDYHERTGADAFHPEVTIAFRVTAPAEHHHVPLLLAPFGYTTYRGS